ncbi:MAG: hypothetical protein FWH04_08860 [Oscillospiraceae bacterium]|nr:hypothetical protein [Oscillospiraceae bacterium]
MNKTGFIAAFAEKADLTKKDSEAIVNAALNIPVSKAPVFKVSKALKDAINPQS